MGYRIEEGDDSHDVHVERFARRKVAIGFTGGQEKTIEFDTQKKTVDSETKFRQYIDTEREQAHPDARLQELAYKQNVFTVANRQDVSYRQLLGTEEKFLVSWDNGATVRVVDPENIDNLFEVTAASKGQSVQQIQEEEPSPSEEVEQALDEQVEGNDTDTSEEDESESMEEIEVTEDDEVTEEGVIEIEEGEKYDTDIPTAEQ